MAQELFVFREAAGIERGAERAEFVQKKSAGAGGSVQQGGVAGQEGERRQKCAQG